MERHFKKSITIDVRNRHLLEDSHRLFNQNGDQMILGDELESLMEGR